MKIHQEGKRIVLYTGVLTGLVASFIIYTGPEPGWLLYLYLALLLVVFALVIFFFRSPTRLLEEFPGAVISPADGTVVKVEQVEEDEYFKKPMIQLSVFMSPFNVHLNRIPANGKVVFYRYHPGKYLVAWHPKSSRLNERNTIIIETLGGIRFMVRQIAGVFARRIVCYCSEGHEVRQGEELGFIKFGSRVDLFLPVGTDIRVKKGDRVKGGVDLLAYFSS